MSWSFKRAVLSEHPDAHCVVHQGRGGGYQISGEDGRELSSLASLEGTAWVSAFNRLLRDRRAPHPKHEG